MYMSGRRTSNFDLAQYIPSAIASGRSAQFEHSEKGKVECKTDTFSSFGYIVGVTAMEDFLRGGEPKSDTEPSWRWQRILRR